MTKSRQVLFILLSMHLYVTGEYGVLLAQSGSDDNTPVYRIEAGGGLSTVKSQAVQSNDTSIAIRVGMSVFGGPSKRVGARVYYDSSTTNFSLNDSQSTEIFQDNVLLWRWGFVHAGVLLHTSQISLVREGAPLIEAFGTGFGGQGGLSAEVGRGNIALLEATFATTGNTQDVLQNEVTIGSRLDIFVGGHIKLTRTSVDLVFGLRQRSYSLDIGGEGFAETSTATWLGLTYNGF